jgi:chromosome segregation ATPase
MTKLTAPDLDALIEQIRTFLADAPKGKPHEGYRYGELLSQAAAALVQLREENARLTEAYGLNPTDPMATACSAALKRAERAEAEVARLTETTTHITWDAQGCRLVNGRLGHEHSAPTVNVQLSGDAEYWKDRAERAEARIAELHDNGTRLREAADSWKEEAQRNQRLVAELEAERDALAGTISQQIDALQRLVCERDMLNADAERYRFIRSPLAGDSGVVQKELWVEFCYKTCREDKMDALIDGAMRLLRYHIDAAKEKP